MGANGTRLSFFGGVAEVGGNKLLLESKGSRIFLDFGMSFKQSGLFFSEFLQPRDGNGLGDYWRTRLLPRFRNDHAVYREDYLRHGRVEPARERDLDGVLISHAHMDHVNYVEFLRADVPVHMSRGADTILRAIESAGNGKAAGEYTRLFPSYQTVPYKNNKGGMRKGTSNDLPPIDRPVERFEATPFRLGEFAVTPFAVDHSLPGAAAFVVESDDARVVYTGDLRFHGRAGHVTRDFVAKAAEHDVDALLVEGTRVTKSADEVPEAEVEAQLVRTMRDCKGLVVANWPPRDVDRMVSFVLAANAVGRRLVVGTKQAVMLKHLEAKGFATPRVGRDVDVFLSRKGWCSWGNPRYPRNVQEDDYEPWEQPFLAHGYARTPDDLRERPRDYVWRCDFFGLHDLIDVVPPPGSVYIQSLTEPFNDDMKLEDLVVKNWLREFGLGEMIRTHASGHVNAEQLIEMIRELRPKVVYPIHTEKPEEFRAIVEKSGVASRVVLPRAPTMEEAMKGEGYFPLS